MSCEPLLVLGCIAFSCCLLAQLSREPDNAIILSDPDQDSKINELLSKAMVYAKEPAPAVADLDKEMDYCQQILALRSDHAAALDLFKSASEMKRKMLADQQQAEKQKASGAAATAKAQGAFLNGDVVRAKTAIDEARRLTPNDEQIESLSQRIDAELKHRYWQKIVAAVFGGALLLTVAAVLVRTIKTPRIASLEIQGEEGEKFKIEKDVVRIGSVESSANNRNDLVVPDPDSMISRFHCEVRKVRGRYYLVDRDSLNGTVLDGRRVQADRLTPLRDGSRINLAQSCELVFVVERKKS